MSPKTCLFILYILSFLQKWGSGKEIKSDYHMQSLTKACYEGIWQMVDVFIVKEPSPLFRSHSIYQRAFEHGCYDDLGM